MEQLKNLENALYEDTEQGTLFRTHRVLVEMGILTENLHFDPKIFRYLLEKFNDDPRMFLYEYYRSMMGGNFEFKNSS